MKIHLAACILSLIATPIYSNTIITGDVTAALGPDFFIDDAATGGDDTTAELIDFDRDLGPLTRGESGSEIIFPGIGWASSSAGTTATQATITITYLGADGIVGGGDDLLFGSRTDLLSYAGAGEYFWLFSTPLSAMIDSANSIFRITVSTNGTGTIRFKGDEGNVKLSVAGTSIGLNPKNLALYRDVVAESNQKFARYATDGVVGSDFKWVMDAADSLPQYLEIEFPGPVEIGSYHLYHGVNGSNETGGFQLEYFTLSGWVLVPGSIVSSNTDSENNVIFTPISVEKLRLKITGNSGDGRPRIREWAVFPYNAGNGYALGTGVTLNMAEGGRTEADSSTTGRAAIVAVDGYLDSYWQSDTVGPHTFDVYLRDEINIKSVHLHSGVNESGTAISDFTVEYSSNSGATWSAATGGAISGNSQTDLVIDFASAVFADAVRLLISDTSAVVIRELQVFPDNELGGYPLFANTKIGAPSDLSYETYSDSYYRILSAVDDRALKADASEAILIETNDLDQAQIFNVLLNADGETYRLFNRESRHCLAVAGASLSTDASVIEESYAGFPSQQWYIRGAGIGLVYIQNTFSGLYLEATTDNGGRAVQRSFDGSNVQQWAIDFQRLYPKKGTAGFPELADDMGASWWYGWTNKDIPELNTDAVDHNPMQWGNFNWDPDNFNAATQLPTTVRFPDWITRGHPFVQMGFNEPDRPDQANISVELAVQHWPELLVSGLPLLSPVTAQVNDSWMVDFMAQADAREFRVDYIGMHTYAGPSPDSIIAKLNSLSAAYDDKPIMLTEFGFSDFSDTQSWTEDELYRELLDLLWRLEDEPNCKRYSFFGFVEDDDYPQPAEPTGRARRSNWQYANGDFTTLGELWMGWDGDLTPNPDQPYILHSRSFDMRVHNDGTSAVADVNIRTSDSSAQVVFESVGDGFYFITSMLDGKRLRQTSSTTVEWASAATTSSDAQWSWSNVERGWQLITNRNSGGNLRFSDTQGVHMGVASGAFYNWFFVPPMYPSETIAPLQPINPQASVSYKQVDLVWGDSNSADLAAYRIKRSTVPGGPFITIATDLYVTNYSDLGLSNGQIYYYIAEAVDLSGNVSSAAAVSATPLAPLPSTYSNWAVVAFDGAPEGTSQLAEADPDGDGFTSFLEYAFLLDPLVIDTNPIQAYVDPVEAFCLSFSVNRHVTDVVWNLYSKTDLEVSNWSPAAFSIISESNSGNLTFFVISPDDLSAGANFFAIGVD
jgi:hypothetical protein